MHTLPIPDFFSPQKVAQLWRVPYQERARQAKTWAEQYDIQSGANDSQSVGLLLIDVQNTFCLPDFELFVAGKSGKGAVEDNIRLCEFIYRNLNRISQIMVTMDTHTAMQIFHPLFWINKLGEHPEPGTMISVEDVQAGNWRINPAVNIQPNMTQLDLQKYALHYVDKLSRQGKYQLTIWPYHSMLGGIGHALVSAVEEAVFFHAVSRQIATHFELKGNFPLTENYSVLSPEVLKSYDQVSIAQKNTAFIEKLWKFDKLIIAGQAKSHCVAWTIEDLLTAIQATEPSLAERIYLLVDCTSPVVIPGVIDFTAEAEAAFERFAQAGMKVINSVAGF